HILSKNLLGVEIDNRAAALAGFALMMKAVAVDRRLLAEGNAVRPNVICLEDVRWAKDELTRYAESMHLDGLLDEPVLSVLHAFEEATNLGSLIQPELGEDVI